MSVPIDENKIVVFSGAGVSAESGLQTFRDSDGLWNNHAVSDVATPEGWQRDQELVLNFYNARRKQTFAAAPNKAHLAIAELEKIYKVIVVTQNVDNLHEKAGSTEVIHVHGELSKARSTVDDSLVYDIKDNDINIGDRCDKGSQLRPHIVWFGEVPQYLDVASEHIKTAAKVLVVGTSLAVYPAAGLVKKARHHAEKILVSLDVEKKPYGFTWLRGTAVNVIPNIAHNWLNGHNAVT
ncbi:NAD-dependent protein deacetylase of SIR2 family [hydrothermal vent metagenome]|uniref:NAD-dependent protein deacetylase of SIR2 family n=1 Tax=hydrothermal vent metagenome TaxID=652676 RepID=A0A3B1B023_9ZZZZ